LDDHQLRKVFMDFLSHSRIQQTYIHDLQIRLTALEQIGATSIDGFDKLYQAAQQAAVSGDLGKKQTQILADIDTTILLVSGYKPEENN